jgi:hypothetical protein
MIEQLGPRAAERERDAQRERERGQRDAQPAERARRQEVHHHRPHEVELLLDGERPAVAERRHLVAHAERRPVGDVEPVPDLVMVLGDHPARHRDEVWPEEERAREKEVVEREDAQRPTRIERRPVVGRAPRVEEDAGDEEAREHEEQLHPGPARLDDRLRDAEEAAVERDGKAQLMKKYKQNRNASDAVERGDDRRRSDGRARSHRRWADERFRVCKKLCATHRNFLQ